MILKYNLSKVRFPIEPSARFSITNNLTTKIRFENHFRKLKFSSSLTSLIEFNNGV